jgi:DNA-directed RNA polymerase subunit beta'
MLEKFDFNKTQNELRMKVVQIITDLLNNLESSHRILKIESISFSQSSVGPTDFAKQRDLRDKGGSLEEKITAKLTLIDKATGKVIATQSNTQIGHIPVLTSRLSYLVQGREYSIPSQFRRLSGVYTKIADNGEIQAIAANDRRGQIPLRFDPDKRIIYIQPKLGSSSEIDLYTLLHGAGKTDDQIAQVWGKGLVESAKSQTNAARMQRNLISKAQMIVGKDVKIPDDKTAAQLIFQELANHTLDPRITMDVLGKAHTTLTPDALLDTGKVLVQVAKREIPESSYNNLGYKRFLDLPDILEDYLQRKKRDIQQKVKNRMTKDRTNPADVLSGVLDQYIRGFFRKGGETQLSSEGNQTNPIAFLSDFTSTTVLGMGGISTGPGMQLGSAVQVHSSHLSFLDPIDTGEGENIGLALQQTIGTQKKGDQIASTLYNMKTGKVELVDPLTADKSIVAFADDIKFQNGKPYALKPKVSVRRGDGKVDLVALKDVQYIMLNSKQMFGVATNTIPFLNNNNGNRNMMGAKMATQAIPLSNREEPLVQIKLEKSGDTVEKALGDISSLLAKVDGKVIKVSETEIVVQSGTSKVSHEMYNNFQTNAVGGIMHHEPVVAVGDMVKKGQLLADSNFTKNGTHAMGSNLRVGYMPYRGLNYEDGVVISRSAANKLTSHHLYIMERDTTVPLGTKLDARGMKDLDENSIVVSKTLFESWAPQSARINQSGLTLLDDDGVAKVGSKIQSGDILIAAVKKAAYDPTLKVLTKNTTFGAEWKPAEVRWEKDPPGTVVRVVKHGKKISVMVRTEEPMTIGDKLVGRYGNKGIITRILEDNEMPFYTDKKGERQHLEVALHPIGFIGRTNPGQLLEVAASKIAEKTRKPYIVDNFNKDSKDTVRELKDEMKKHGVSDQELVYDPETNKALGNVLAGKQYIYKLQHQVDKKITARAGGTLPGIKGAQYDINHQAVKGAGIGGQAMGALGMYALLAHNARANIQEMQTHHSTYELPTKPGEYSSDEYWYSLMNGMPTPSPQPTFATKKFFDYLKAMGINPVRNADEFQLVPMTDKDVLKQCPHKVTNPSRAIMGKTGAEEKGGLFDFPDGKFNSKAWGHMELATRIINPVFERPIAILLDILQKDISSVLSGKMQFSGGTGMKAVITALSKIDVNSEVKRLIALSEKQNIADRDKTFKKLKILKNLQRLNVSPYEAYTMKYVPVLPPVMRPIGISDMVDNLGDIKSSDVNSLYRQIGMANIQVREFPPEGLPETRQELENELYDTVKKTYVEGALDNKGSPVSSLLQYITNPKTRSGLAQGKEGFYQSKVISRRIELSGRSVIIPEPDLTLDEVGLPKKMAMVMYRPFIIREIIGAGYSPAAAVKIYREEPNSATVVTALEKAVKTRPMMLKRDPMLHKHSLLAFYPKIIDAKTIQIHPMVCKGFGADFDGDTMACFVPAGPKAVEEAKGMLPSKNLFGAKDFELMNIPEWDSAYGIWQLSDIKFQGKQSFSNMVDAYLANKSNKLELREGFKYKNGITTIGRMKLLDAIPEEIRPKFVDKVLYGPSLTKKVMESVLKDVARTRRDLFPKLADAWKALGNSNAFDEGSSVGLQDLESHKDIRDKHLKIADQKLAKLKTITDADKITVFSEANANIEKELKNKLAENPHSNRMYLWTAGSGAANGKYEQFKQMISAPLQVQDADSNVSPEPIRKAYSEGFKGIDYWNSLPGVRAGTLARKKGTMEPGARAKDIINLGINLVVTEDDCGTHAGVAINTEEKDTEGRFLCEPVTCGQKTYKYNTLIDSDILSDIRKEHKSVKVRSSLTCAMTKGVCKKCQGLTEMGREYEIGENAGVNSAQSLSEPLTQMAMKLFHTGGAATGGSSSHHNAVDRLTEIFEMPKTLRNKATITTIDGSVKKIEEDKVAGGYVITIDAEQFRVPAGKQLLVGVGDDVTKGQALCNGPINPHELLECAGMGAVRGYLLKEMHSVYGSYGIRRRHVETILRNMTNTVQIIKDPEYEILPGESIARTQALNINEERKKESKAPLEFKPILKSIYESVQLNTEGDFLAGLNYQEIRNVVTEGVTYGAKSKLHGLNPLPGIAFGAEFGKGDSKLKGSY